MQFYGKYEGCNMKYQNQSSNGLRLLTKHDGKVKIRLFSGLMKAEIRSMVSLKKHAKYGQREVQREAIHGGSKQD